MEPIDNQLLMEMREVIAAYRSKFLSLGSLADQLLAIRDCLQFRDDVWSHELTQHIATLDSASTFVPKEDEQARQLSNAITSAIDGLLRLIDNELT